VNYSEYQERIKEFAVYPRIGNNLSYPVLGLINELGEFIDKLADNSFPIKQAEDEAGDCYWYIGTIYNEIGENWSTVLEENNAEYMDAYNCAQTSEIDMILGCSLLVFAKMAGYAKKAERENNGKLLKKHQVEFVRELLSIHATLDYLFNKSGISTLQALKNNLSKLQSRKERNVLHGDGDNR